MKKIVLTGGPCGGKSTALAYLREKLTGLGFQVLCVPEVASQVISSGVSIKNLSEEQLFKLEEKILEKQLSEEDFYEQLLKILGGKPEKRVLICDRGCYDIKAYVSLKTFEGLLKKVGLTESKLNKRYQVVCHLVTAADGKERFYIRNNVRQEKPAAARLLDRKIRNAWLGYEHFKIIDNAYNFKNKMKALLRVVQHFLGIPVSLEIEKRFLIRGKFDEENLSAPRQTVYLEQVYLKKQQKGVIRRIRKRWLTNSEPVYYFTEKRSAGRRGVNIETEKCINHKKYQELLKNRDPRREKIVKKRIYFVWKKQYFSLDIFLKPQRLSGRVILEIELTEENDRVDLPYFLHIEKEITGDPRYSNSNLAKKPKAA